MLLDTKAVSGTGEGTHTTSRRQLIVLDKGMMFIDTPGMRELGLLGTSDWGKQRVEDIIELCLIISSNPLFTPSLVPRRPSSLIPGVSMKMMAFSITMSCRRYVGGAPSPVALTAFV